MKIYFKKHRIYLKYNFGISRSKNDWFDRIYVYLKKDNVTGIGEAAPSPRYNESISLVEKTLKNLIDIPQSYTNHEEIWEYLLPQLNQIKCLEAAFSMALLDYMGKIKNKTVLDLLELEQDKVHYTSYTIAIGKNSQIKEKVKEAEPYKILKVKLGTADNDKNIIKEIRNYTDKKIRVDANEGWTLNQGLEICEWLNKYNIELIEQPFSSDKMKDTKKLKQCTDIDIYADENSCTSKDIPKIYSSFDGVNIKLMKCGSIFEAIDMIKVAKKYNLKIMLGCMIETSVAISAAAQIAGQVDLIDLDGNLLIKNDPFRGPEIHNGILKLSSDYGLGLNLKKEFNNLEI
jgi:L-alanine-DL-glutamate epimerase-like enolase superfamily enzyme